MKKEVEWLKKIKFMQVQRKVQRKEETKMNITIIIVVVVLK